MAFKLYQASFYLASVGFFLGQLLPLNIGLTTIPIFNICLLPLFVLNLFHHFRTSRLRPTNVWTLAFLGYCLVNLITNLAFYHFQPINPILYLFRLGMLLSFFIWPLQIPPKASHFFNLIIISHLIFGFLQYFLWPNLTYFNALNWDPHLNRLVSTFFDPTFTALLYLLFLISNYFYSPSYLLIFPYLGLALTYSRSTFLAFLISFSCLACRLKKPILFIATLLIFCLTLIILPRFPGEGTKLSRTSTIKAKIVNYQEGLSLFLKSPISGYGFNTLSQVRAHLNPSSHAASGFDSSLLTIMVTTGIPGLFLFVLGFKTLYLSSPLPFRICLLATFIHSLFANSLLYPWTLFYLAILYSHPRH
jgi:hypothetical protein